jgi:hypothetical protein
MKEGAAERQLLRASLDDNSQAIRQKEAGIRDQLKT